MAIFKKNVGTLWVLRRILIRIAEVLFFLTLGPIILLLLLVLRPFVLIRVGLFRTDAIGHLAINHELYLCHRDTGKHPPRSFDIFFINHSSVANDQLTKMFKDKLRIYNFAYYIYRAITFYPGFNQHMLITSAWDKYGIFDDSKTHLFFSPEEIEIGKKTLNEIGIGEKKFICINARDSAYKKFFNPTVDRSYHDYNNVDIDTYLPTAKRMADNGFYIVRMGSVVAKKLISSNPKIIDYATNGIRTDFLDIYLSANCYFFISNGTGLDSVPKIFHRPILYVNLIPLEHINAESARDLIIVKKVWKRDEHRLMTFREILESGVGRFLHTHHYEENNLEIVHNTPEEIEAATMEMDERLKGTWKSTEEDEELQKRFWALFKPSFINKVFLSRIGAVFLRENKELLL